MAVLNLAASLQFIRSGRLKALAYVNDPRSPLLPDVPTLAEAGVKGVELASWYSSLAVPKGHAAGNPAAPERRGGQGQRQPGIQQADAGAGRGPVECGT